MIIYKPKNIDDWVGILTPEKIPEKNVAKGPSELREQDIQMMPSPNYVTEKKMEDWTDVINELYVFFQSTDLPPPPIKLDECATITDAALFIQSHLAVTRANNGNKVFLPYMSRLISFKQQF